MYTFLKPRGKLGGTAGLCEPLGVLLLAVELLFVFGIVSRLSVVLRLMGVWCPPSDILLSPSSSGSECSK